jgi:Na+/H+ antiporter NhaD/arsenite permease-like protein
MTPTELLGFPIEFFLFGLVLAGVALLHRHATAVALTGLVAITAYKLAFAGFPAGPGIPGLLAHAAEEWVILANLLLLLVGFGLLSNHFEQSQIPEAMPAWLPDNWTGGLALLAMVFVLSAFLDNIAAAVIGGVVAKHVYRGQVSVGFLAALVAAANAGGAGSVIGDTTTTMMWISGVSPFEVLHAFIGSFVAFAVFGTLGALQQQQHAPIVPHAGPDVRIDWMRAVIVLILLTAIVATNAIGNANFPELEHTAPALGLALWIALLATSAIRRPDWSVIPPAAKGAVFLVALVACASMMPVERLPPASWQTAFGLGFLSAVFDNIPLTALAIEQGGYDWGLLAYAVGFGGSMIWFGSSAGVALTTSFPEGRSVLTWVRQGWFVVPAYVMGFFAILLLT